MKHAVRKKWEELTKHEIRQFLECISFIQNFECPLYMAKSMWTDARKDEINNMPPEKFMSWAKQKQIKKPKTKKDFKKLNHIHRVEVVDFLKEFHKNNVDS